MGLELSSRMAVDMDAAPLQRVSRSPLPAADSAVPLGGLNKRAFDVCFALIALIALSPFFILVAIAVKASDTGPIFFRHRRIGTNGRTFECLKFRTMRTNGAELLEQHFRTNAEARREWLETRKLKNDPRVTPVGIYLRKTSLDELPQLLNILAGAMSVVGPRPIVADEVAMYGADAGRYFATRPGLTGAWQVSGRNDTTYEERVRLDRAYVEGWTFATDLMIIMRTIPAVFLSRGSY